MHAHTIFRQEQLKHIIYPEERKKDKQDKESGRDKNTGSLKI